MRRSLLITALLLHAVPALAAKVAVNGLRMWADDSSTRVVLDLSGPAAHRLLTLSEPNRVVVDLPGASLASSALPPAQGVVKSIRSGQRAADELRIVLDLAQPVRARSFLVEPSDKAGHRLVIDLLDPAQASEVKRAAHGDGRRVVIAIDPGHGGKDPGAIGKKGTREKDVVLQIARRLARLIDAEPGMKAVLTREGDYSISLSGRMKKARRERADIFVSIHADAYRDKSAHGSTVYVLSERGASSEAARWLAERENAADLVGGVSLDDKDDVLASVLLDLSQTATISASVDVGQKVIGKLGSVGRVRKKQVQQAGFKVLKSPDIPSILVETAFISNPSEERRLQSADAQDKWARAILGGVRDYFYARPPPGTQLAQRRDAERPREVEYVISRGDTLSEIADRFNVKLRVLRSVNGIKSDRIRVGQRLQIPAS